MISNKRISKLKKEIYKLKGDPKFSRCIVKTKEGLYLFELKKGIEQAKGVYKPIEKLIDGIKLIECECSIKDILIVGTGESELTIILDDV